MAEPLTPEQWLTGYLLMVAERIMRDPDEAARCGRVITEQIAARATAPGLDETFLGSLSEDDVMYDHPVSQTGEPMDPVLYVRWGAIEGSRRG